MIYFNNYFIKNDSNQLWQMTFQDEASPIMIGIRDLHDNILFYLIIIISFVGYFLLINIYQKGIRIRSKDLNHSSIVEFIWTIIPAIILIFIAIPSFKLLFTMDEVLKPIITLKIQGSQWFWSYSILDTIGINIDFLSYIKDDLEKGELRLLEVDNRILLPINTPIRILVTSNDVMHAWAIPSLGVKIDAIPGRINHSLIYILREGVYYGQCSELCGQGHAYMPIVIEAVQIYEYISWLISNLDFNISKYIHLSKFLSFFL